MEPSTSQGDNLFADLPAMRLQEPALLVRPRHFMADFLSRFRSNSVLFLTGKHGVGKSTFIMNDLLPMLEEGYALHGLEQWQIVEITSDPYPIMALAEAMVDLQAQKQRQNPALAKELHALYLKQPMAFLDSIQEVLEQHKVNLLFYFDKFQYAYPSSLERNTDQEKEWDCLQRIIERVSQQKAYPIHILATVEEDFTSKLLAMEGLSSIVNEGLIRYPHYEQRDFERFIERIQEEFFLGLDDKVRQELEQAYVGENLTHADLSIVLRAMYTAFLKDDKAGSELSVVHLKGVGGIQNVYSKIFQSAFKKLADDQKKLLEACLKLLVQSSSYNASAYSVRSLTLGQMADALDSSAVKLAHLFRAMNSEGLRFFVSRNLNRIEHRLAQLRDEKESSQEEGFRYVQIRLANPILAERVGLIKTWADNFYRDLSFFEEVVNDLCKDEPLYRDHKLQRALEWKQKTAITASLGPFLSTRYHEAIAFIDRSQKESETMKARLEAEEKSRLQKEKRFRLTVGISAALALIFIIIATQSASRLVQKQLEIAAVEDTLRTQADSLMRLQVRSDSAALQIQRIQSEIEEKIFETQQKERELARARLAMLSQQDSLILIEDALKRNMERQKALIQIQDSLQLDAERSIQRANIAKAEAALTSSINAINSMIFTADQMLRNRTSLDLESLADAGSIAIMAYDSLETTLLTPFAMSVSTQRFEETKKQLYSLLTAVYSQASSSALNAKSAAQLTQGRVVSLDRQRIYLAGNSGKILRMSIPLSNRSTEALKEAEQQQIKGFNAQIRQLRPLNTENHLLLRLADGRLVAYDFYYNQISSELAIRQPGLSTHPPFYSAPDGGILSLIGSRLLSVQFESGQLSSKTLLRLQVEADPWVNMAYHEQNQILVIRTAQKSLEIYRNELPANRFKLQQEVYVDELPADISTMHISQDGKKLFLGLQNGVVGNLQLNNKTGALETDSWQRYEREGHEGAVLSLYEYAEQAMLVSTGMDAQVFVRNSSEAGLRAHAYFHIQDIQPVHQVLFADNKLISISSSFEFSDNASNGRLGFWPLSLQSMAEKVRSFYKEQGIRPDKERLMLLIQ